MGELPHKRWWLEHRPEELRERARADVAGFGAATMALLTVVLLGATAGARADPPSLPWWALAALVVYLVGVLGWWWWSYRAYRPPAVPED